jgi:hypothetical protein
LAVTTISPRFFEVAAETGVCGSTAAVVSRETGVGAQATSVRKPARARDL